MLLNKYSENISFLGVKRGIDAPIFRLVGFQNRIGIDTELEIMVFSIDLMLLALNVTLEQSLFLKQVWMQITLFINILKHMKSLYLV